MDGTFVKSNSHCKSMQRRRQPTRITEYSTVTHLVQSEGKLKDRARSQPVKIFQLLNPAERPKSVQKVSVKKKVEPERVANLFSKKENTCFSEKKLGTNTYRERISPHRHARRVLNFNDISNTAMKSREDEIKPLRPTVTDSVQSKNVQRPSRKRSSLLPPNSIKMMHLKKCSGTVNPFSNVVQQSKSNVQNNKSNGTEKDCTAKQTKDNSSKIGHIQPPKLAITSIHNLSVIDDANSKCSSFDTVSVNREELSLLETNLKHLITAAEENIAKLKSALEHVSKISVNASCVNQCTKCSKNTETNVYPTEEKNEFSQVIVSHPIESCKITLDKEVQTDMIEELSCQIISNVKDLLISDSEQCDEDNKENVECSDMSTLSNVKHNDSFLALEDKLNITHMKCLSAERSVCPNTPTIKQFKTRGERSLREYMVLKSSMSFLETPDAKRFRSLCIHDNTQDRGSTSKSYISSKVLANLHNLYSESPDT